MRTHLFTIRTFAFVVSAALLAASCMGLSADEVASMVSFF